MKLLVVALKGIKQRSKCQECKLTTQGLHMGKMATRRGGSDRQEGTEPCREL